MPGRRDAEQFLLNSARRAVAELACVRRMTGGVAWQTGDESSDEHVDGELHTDWPTPWVIVA